MNEVRQEAAATGELPLAYMLRIMRDPSQPVPRRDDRPRPPLRFAIRAFRRLSIRVRSRARPALYSCSRCFGNPRRVAGGIRAR